MTVIVLKENGKKYVIDLKLNMIRRNEIIIRKELSQEEQKLRLPLDIVTLMSSNEDTVHIEKRIEMKLCPHCHEEVDQLIEFKIGHIVKTKNSEYFKYISIPKGLSPDSYYKISNVTLTLIYIINDYGEEDNYLISDFLPVSIDELILLLNNKEK